MVIFGLHRMTIGIIDYIIELALHPAEINFRWYEGVFLAIFVEVILLPCIIMAQKRYKFLLGKKWAPNI